MDEFLYFLEGVLIFGSIIPLILLLISRYQEKKDVTLTPRSSIASAAQGQNEIAGELLLIPETKTPTGHLGSYWRYELFSHLKQRVIENKESAPAIIIDDGTGLCFINPKDLLLLDGKVSAKRWDISTKYPKHAFSFSINPRYRYIEYVVDPISSLFINGNFITYEHTMKKTPFSEKLLTFMSLENKTKLLKALMIKYDKTESEIKEHYRSFFINNQLNLITKEGMLNEQAFVITELTEKAFILSSRKDILFLTIAIIGLITYSLLNVLGIFNS